MSQVAINPEFVRGVYSAEDLGRIPGTDWIITSCVPGGDEPKATTYFANTRTRELVEAYPGNFSVRLDVDAYGEIDPPTGGIFHGLVVRPGTSTVHALYQINHAKIIGTAAAGREAVEVFEIDASASPPVLTWVGAVPIPDWAYGNDICALPEGGFALTNMGYPGANLIMTGGPSGNVIEWHDHEIGWMVVEGTDLNMLNGMEVSPDGKYFYVVLSHHKQLGRISRTDCHGDRKFVPIPLMGDNLTWTPDGKLMLTGQDTTPEILFPDLGDFSKPEVGYPFVIMKIDPDTLDYDIVARHDGTEICATSALDVGDAIWVGSVRSRALTVFPVS